ncbi:MAG: hypothetical protein WCG23_07400 [bacterium]
MCNIYKFNKEKPELKTNERISKLFTAKIKKYDTLFIGSSRTDFALDPKHYYNLTKKKALNLGIGGSDISESKIILQKLIKTHPNLKTIILEVDYFGFNSTHKINSNEKIDSYISLNDFFKLFLSYDSIKKSISTINYNFKTPNKFIYDYNGLRIKTPEHNSYNLALAEINGVLTKNKNYSLDISRLQNLQEIKRLCKQNNIKLIVFVSPLNFAEIHGINLTGNFNKYLNWRKEISKITSFYDFSMGNYITYEPLKPHMRYYFDSHHYTIEVGQKILDKILNKSNIESNDNFGVIITMNNIDKYNKEFYLEYKNWALNNKIIVKKINLLKNGG